MEVVIRESVIKLRKTKVYFMLGKKISIFFCLPYWKSLLVRYNLDVMHIEKNVCENILCTLLNIDKKSKDNCRHPNLTPSRQISSEGACSEAADPTFDPNLAQHPKTNPKPLKPTQAHFTPKPRPISSPTNPTVGPV